MPTQTDTQTYTTFSSHAGVAVTEPGGPHIKRSVIDIQPAESLRGETSHVSINRTDFGNFYRCLFRTSIPLFIGDLVSLYCAIGFAWVLNRLAFGTNVLGHDKLFAFLPFAILAHMIASGCYPLSGVNPAFEFQRIVTASTQAFVLVAAFCLAHYQSGLFVAASVFCTVGIPASMLMVVVRRLLRKRLSAYAWWGFPVLFIGRSERLENLFTRLTDRPWLGYRPIGYVSNVDGVSREEAHKELGMIAAEHQSFVAVTETDDYRGYPILGAFPHVYVASQTRSGSQSLWISSVELAGLPCQLRQSRLDMPWNNSTKRFVEVSLCLAAGIFLAPVLFAIYAIVRLTSPGSAFYSQKRVGKDGKEFAAWKFRSMLVNADEALADHLEAHPELKEEWDRDHKLKDDPRITWIGKLLRTTSLDELPQLWNILCGEMSLVGPRPIVEAEIKKYADNYTTYSKVKPGLTGLWQISGRNHTTYEERVQLDAYYVMNWSLWLDAYIVIRTLKTVACREGAY